MVKRIVLILTVVILLISLCIGLLACKVKVNDPSVTDEKAELVSLEIKAENGTWHNISDEQAQALFSIVKSVGELSGEPLDIAISGNSTIKTEYDYTFRMSFSYGNFFLKKTGEFVYNVGERFTRTYSDGKVVERIEEDKLVVSRSLSKDTAKLSEAQLQTIKDIFEPVNAEVMKNALENVATKHREEGYNVSEIPTEDLADTVFTLCNGSPLQAEENLIKGYKIDDGFRSVYVFLTTSVEWAKKMEKYVGVDRVGRVFYKGDLFLATIKNTLQQ